MVFKKKLKTKQQQGRGFLADLFKSFSKTGTGSLVSVYTVPTADSGAVPPVLPTTALVKSIRISNPTGSAITTKVVMVDASNTNLSINLFLGSLAAETEQEILTQPIVLEQEDKIDITGGSTTILISLMEIT